MKITSVHSVKHNVFPSANGLIAPKIFSLKKVQFLEFRTANKMTSIYYLIQTVELVINGAAH